MVRVIVPLVSLIVPVRGDARPLAVLLAQVTSREDMTRFEPAEVEVIVSCARPVEEALADVQARFPQVVWVEANPGRGTQLNAGASRASGQWLWFVHADSVVPGGWLEAFRNLERAPDAVVGGAFRFALDSQAWQARLLERGVRFRVKWFNLPYGDQGIFVRRSVFEAIGGFPATPLMEDVVLVQRLKRSGRLRHLNLDLITSARRWEQEGWLRRSARNLLTLALYHAGVSPERLARRYYGGRGTSPAGDDHANQETR
jgi:rSAM/selenodomain-associated transferase 2